MPDERYLSAKDIQTRLKIGRARSYEVIAEMPRVKFGASVRVSETAFAAWLKERELPAPPPSPADARRLRIEARKREIAKLEREAPPIRRTRPRT